MKIRKPHFLFVVCILAMFTFSTVFPCTTFVLRQGNRIIFGRNLDWYSGTGLVIVNPRNIEKVAIVNPSEKAIKWVSKFGSITFNQVGRELPFGGINESGLVVEHMTLDETVYPAKDNRYAIGAFQWIQYQLDNYSTIEEVINSDTFLRIEDNSKIHFLICDRSGNSAAIEFLNGKMVYLAGKDLPVSALANSTYEESLRCYKTNGNTLSNPSLYHFCTAAKQISGAHSSNDSTIDYTFRTLNMVSQALFTKWSIVYDITNMRIYFKVFETPTIVGESKIFTKQPPYDPITKVIDFKGMDFNCFGVVKVFDINSNHDNDVNQYFIPYSTEVNKEFINMAFTFYKGWGLPIELKEDDLNSLAKYPESFRCIGDK
jgi:Linear amide C-N hydrolases, choloylglycine hydrolase family